MSDPDERIARLTELARKLWPGATVELCDRNYEGTERSVQVLSPGEHGNYVQIEVNNQKRALDAAEAALRVLAGEPSAAEQELRKRVGELEQLLAVQKNEGLLANARRERDRFEQALQRLRDGIKETLDELVNWSLRTSETDEQRIVETSVIAGLRALLSGSAVNSHPSKER